MGKYLGALKVPVLEHNDNFMESPFGTRTYKGKKEQHNGIDLHTGKSNKDNTKDNVIAIESGRVVKVSFSKTRGNYVEIKHNANYTTRYLHMANNSIKVKANQNVLKGAVLGIDGMTGSADSVHVHLAVIKNGNYVDPLPYLTGEQQINPILEKNVPYKMLKKKFKRYGACVGNNKVPYKVLSATDKDKCNNVGGYARTKIGAIYTFYDFILDSKGNWWGCTTKPTSKQPKKHYICVYDNTGYQVEKVEV